MSDYAKILEARWQSPGARYFVNLYKQIMPYGTSYFYECDNGGGSLPSRSLVDAISNIESRLSAFNADAAKRPLRRVL
jgi:hypothetical protein